MKEAILFPSLKEIRTGMEPTYSLPSQVGNGIYYHNQFLVFGHTLWREVGTEGKMDMCVCVCVTFWDSLPL